MNEINSFQTIYLIEIIRKNLLLNKFDIQHNLNLKNFKNKSLKLIQLIDKSIELVNKMSSYALLGH
jgi:hypothetical protein